VTLKKNAGLGYPIEAKRGTADDRADDREVNIYRRLQEREERGSVVFKGGSAVVLSKKEFCTAVVVIAAVLVVAATLLAAPAWAQAELDVVRSDNPDPVAEGELLTYTLTVENEGIDNAQDVVVRDELPDQVDFVSADESQGDCDEQPEGVVECELGDLEGGKTATVQILVGAQEAGTISNTAVVFAKGGEEAIDQDTETTTVEDDRTIDDRDQTNVCRNVVNIIVRNVQNPDVDVNNEQAVSGSVSGDVSNEQVVEVAQELNISPVIVQQCIQNVGGDEIIGVDDNNNDNNNSGDNNDDDSGDTGVLDSGTNTIEDCIIVEDQPQTPTGSASATASTTASATTTTSTTGSANQECTIINTAPNKPLPFTGGLSVMYYSIVAGFVLVGASLLGTGFGVRRARQR